MRKLEKEKQAKIVYRHNPWRMAAFVRRNENMLQTYDYAFLDHLLEGCQIVNSDFRYLYVNDTAARQERKSKDELLGHTMLELYPSIETTPMFSVLKRCMNEREPAEVENEFTYPDGTTARFALKMEPVPEGVSILSVDISSHKRAKIESQSHFHRIKPVKGSDKRQAYAAFGNDYSQPSNTADAHDMSNIKDWPDALEFEGWSENLVSRTKETEEHTLRVAKMTVTLARMAGISESEIVYVRRGALLHDIGKMGIPDTILLKPDKLTDDEWVVMRRHPDYAYDLLYPIEYLRLCLPIPYSHHEKWDGTGYPQGLKGEQIPLSARLFAVADVWDALSCDRVYREAWPQNKVMKHIRQQSMSHFDPKAVELFLSAIREKTCTSTW